MKSRRRRRSGKWKNKRGLSKGEGVWKSGGDIQERAMRNEEEAKEEETDMIGERQSRPWNEPKTEKKEDMRGEEEWQIEGVRCWGEEITTTRNSSRGGKRGGNNHKGNGRKRAERKEVDAEAVVGKDEAANETRIEDLRRIGRTIRREKEDNRTKKRKKGWGTIRKG